MSSHVVEEEQRVLLCRLPSVRRVCWAEVRGAAAQHCTALHCKGLVVMCRATGAQAVEIRSQLSQNGAGDACLPRD